MPTITRSPTVAPWTMAPWPTDTSSPRVQRLWITRAVLNVAALADLDGLQLRAADAVEPEGGALADGHIAADHRARHDKDVLVRFNGLEIHRVLLRFFSLYLRPYRGKISAAEHRQLAAVVRRAGDGEVGGADHEIDVRERVVQPVGVQLLARHPLAAGDAPQGTPRRRRGGRRHSS